MSSTPSGFIEETHQPHQEGLPLTATHDLQRKAALTHGGPVNHKKNVYYTRNKEFDLNKTIFGNVSGLFGFRRLQMIARLGNTILWDPQAKEQIEKEYEAFVDSQRSVVLREPAWVNYDSLLEFMKNECNFNAEHADGSFMDHLYFCRDFSKAYYPEQSPRILFLHSIMGVGTNFFPMDASKVPKLEAMLHPDEFKQVATFPSILRLMNQKNLIDDLLNSFKNGTLHQLESITVHRVIDNQKVTLTASEFWVAMNLQLIHQLDFLPCSNWCTQVDDPLFQVFVDIYDLMKTTGKIDSGLHWNIEEIRNLSEKDEFGMPLSLVNLVSKLAPKSFKRSQIKKSIENYSKAINHDLTYHLAYKA